MNRLLSDEVLDALVDIFNPHDRNRYELAPILGPGWAIDRHTGQPVYSSAWIESDDIEGYSRQQPPPDQLEIRRRQRELQQRDMTRTGRGRR